MGNQWEMIPALGLAKLLIFSCSVQHFVFPNGMGNLEKLVCEYFYKQSHKEVKEVNGWVSLVVPFLRILLSAITQSKPFSLCPCTTSSARAMGTPGI